MPQMTHPAHPAQTGPTPGTTDLGWGGLLSELGVPWAGGLQGIPIPTLREMGATERRLSVGTERKKVNQGRR